MSKVMKKIEATIKSSKVNILIDELNEVVVVVVLGDHRRMHLVVFGVKIRLESLPF